MTNNEILKKQIIYRSMHRGTKEMDILLGNFVKKYIKNLTNSDLLDLKELLYLDDDILSNWYFDKSNNNIVPENKISLLLKKFKI